MTSIAPASPLITSARRFSIALHRAMRAQGLTQRRLADQLDVGRSRVANWAAGTSLPSVELAGRMADILCAPALVSIAAEARRRPCDNCGKPFVAAEHSPARYCSVACKRNQVKQVEGRRDLSRAVLARRVAVLDRAVAAMCAECEPDGLCRTPTCPLQVAGVSPNRIERTA